MINRRLSLRSQLCAALPASSRRSPPALNRVQRLDREHKRLGGSADIYHTSGHLPINSINYITCHDGFTLDDLVSYNDKHNEANGEGNRDGINENLSWNCGAEGPTEDPAIEGLRERQIKNFAAILMLSRGVPMFVAGNEVRRTQKGNNNAYERRGGANALRVHHPGGVTVCRILVSQDPADIRPVP